MEKLIKAVSKNGSFLDQVRSRRNEDHHFHLWWLGQSGFLIQWNGKHLLIDPYLSDSLTRKYQDTDKPHIRMSELVISPEKLDFIDLVTSSHNHTDHLDGETLKPLIEVNPSIKMIIPEANREFVAERIGQDPDFPIGLNEGGSVQVDDFRINGVPAAHNELDRDENGRCLYMGYVFQFENWTIYHSGDTLWHDNIINSLRPFSIDLALLPINGNKPERRVAGNLNYIEAVEMSQQIGARHTIPCHYNMFTFNTEDPEKFGHAAKIRRQKYTILEIGAYFSSEMI